MIGHLKQMPEHEQVVRAATLSVLSREPTQEERDALKEYLTRREDRREAAIKQMVWALVSSPEFRFNH